MDSLYCVCDESYNSKCRCKPICQTCNKEQRRVLCVCKMCQYCFESYERKGWSLKHNNHLTLTQNGPYESKMMCDYIGVTTTFKIPLEFIVGNLCLELRVDISNSNHFRLLNNWPMLRVKKVMLIYHGNQIKCLNVKEYPLSKERGSETMFGDKLKCDGRCYGSVLLEDPFHSDEELCWLEIADLIIEWDTVTPWYESKNNICLKMNKVSLVSERDYSSIKA